MSKQLLVIVGVLAATFFAGIGIGYLLASNPQHPAGTAPTSARDSTSSFFSDAAAQDREQNNTLLSSRIRELEKELSEQKQDPAAIMRDEFALFKKYRNRGIYLQGFSAFPSPQQDVKISDALSDLLKLSDSERQSTEQLLTQAKNEMVSLRDAGAFVAKRTPDSVIYEIPVDPQGQAIKDQMSQSLVQNLGPDRAAFLMDSSDFTAPMSVFGGFSEQKTDIQINWTTDSASGKQLYTWRVSNNGSISSGETPSEWIPDSLKQYVPSAAP